MNTPPPVPKPALLRIAKYYLTIHDSAWASAHKEFRYTGLSPRKHATPGNPEGKPNMVLSGFGAGLVYIYGGYDIDVKKLVEFIESHDERAKTPEVYATIEFVEITTLASQLRDFSRDVYLATAEELRLE